MMDPIRHLICGDECVVRWILDDAGEAVIVAWCERCHAAPAPAETSRAIDFEDIPLNVVRQAAAHNRAH